MGKKIKISKWIACPVIGLLIAMGTGNPVLTYLAAAAAAASVLLYNEEDSLCVLFFSVSFTHAFKSSINSTSFFVMLLMLYVIWHMNLSKPLHSVVGWIIFFTGYVSFIHWANFNIGIEIVQLVKFTMNLLFLYIAVQQVNGLKSQNLFLFYIFGVLMTSFLKYSALFPNLSLYTDGNVDVDRFTGMYEDPNYYGVSLLVCLCLVVVMYHRGDISIWILLVLTGLLVWFAALTISKMVFLMLSMPILSFIYSNHVKRRYGLQVISVAVLAGLLVLVFSDKIEIFHSVLRRFREASDAASLTTGRAIVWKNYIDYILNSPKVLLFGEGMNASPPTAISAVPHNTYIDFIYNLGIIGTIGWIYCVGTVFRISNSCTKRNFINASVYVSIAITCFALSKLLYFDFPFHLLLAYIVWNIPMDGYRKDKQIR